MVQSLAMILRSKQVTSAMTRSSIVDLMRAMLQGTRARSRGSPLSPPPMSPGAAALTEAVFQTVSAAGAPSRILSLCICVIVGEILLYFFLYNPQKSYPTNNYCYIEQQQSAHHCSSVLSVLRRGRSTARAPSECLASVGQVRSQDVPKAEFYIF